MAQKLTHIISSAGGQDANFTDLTNIESGRLSSDDTVVLYAGSYTDPGAAATRFQGVTLVGIGHRDEVVINGFTIPDSFTGDITFKNISFASPGVSIGNTSATVRFYDCLFAGANSLNRSASLALGNACITKGVAGASYAVVANSTLFIENSEFSPGTAYAVVAHDFGANYFRNTLIRGDAGALSNGACTFDRVTLLGANNIVSTPAAVLAAPAHSYKTVAAASSNAGNCTKTAVALLS